MEFKELQEKVVEWANKRDLIKGGSRGKQLKKCYEEFGELCRADIKNDRKEIIDSIGDMLVCLINYAEITHARISDYKDVPYVDEILDDVKKHDDLIIDIGKHLGRLSDINSQIDSTCACSDTVSFEVSSFILRVVLSIKRYAESQDLDIVNV
jgi:phosphoribosyl-ATP pyrophosphohydrolase